MLQGEKLVRIALLKTVRDSAPLATWKRFRQRLEAGSKQTYISAVHAHEHRSKHALDLDGVALPVALEHIAIEFVPIEQHDAVCLDCLLSKVVGVAEEVQDRPTHRSVVPILLPCARGEIIEIYIHDSGPPLHAFTQVRRAEVFPDLLLLAQERRNLLAALVGEPRWLNPCHLVEFLVAPAEWDSAVVPTACETILPLALLLELAGSSLVAARTESTAKRDEENQAKQTWHGP